MDSRRVCAIHQPNLFPRLSTIAKLLRADVWVVLDDVQFNGRDYQHRTRLATLEQPLRQQWLTLPVHRPRGQRSLISEIVLAEPEKSCRRLMGMTQQYFGKSLHWPLIAALLDVVLPHLAASDRLANVTEASTSAVLRAAGWRGQVVRSSCFKVRPERSQRLADLVKAVNAHTYLCGTGGANYIDGCPFRELEVHVSYISTAVAPPPEWSRLSVLRALAAGGLDPLRSPVLAAPLHKDPAWPV